MRFTVAMLVTCLLLIATTHVDGRPSALRKAEKKRILPALYPGVAVDIIGLTKKRVAGVQRSVNWDRRKRDAQVVIHVEDIHIEKKAVPRSVRT